MTTITEKYKTIQACLPNAKIPIFGQNIPVFFLLECGFGETPPPSTKLEKSGILGSRILVLFRPKLGKS